MNQIIPIKETSPRFNKNCSYRIKLKSINEERALNRTEKLNKSSDIFLTNQKFENERLLNSSVLSQKNKEGPKINYDQLQIEIALATTKALSSIRDFQSSKASNHPHNKSTNRINRSNTIASQDFILPIKKNNQAKVLTEQNLNSPCKKIINKNNSSNNSSKSMILQEKPRIEKKIQKNNSKTPKKSEKCVIGHKSNRLSLKDQQITDRKKQQESVFIDKIKEATLKLRKLRENSSENYRKIKEFPPSVSVKEIKHINY